MRTTPKFVTKDDYFNYTNQDLDELIKVKDKSSNLANLFLLRIEDRLMSYIDAETYRVFSFDHLSPIQLEYFQKAIIEQAEYILRNGDLFTDSGYDPDEGQKIDFSKLYDITISKTAINYLKNAGLYNKVIINRRRFTDFR